MTNLVPQKSANLIPAVSDWQTMKEMAEMLIKTGFLPRAITKPEQAVAIMLKGRELGVPPMLALSHISVVQGKPGLDSQLMLALIYQRYPKAEIRYDVLTAEKCIVMARRDNTAEFSVFEFTFEDAVRMGLSQKDNWKRMPKVMLKWRAVSEMARSVFPDAIAGAYPVEELNPDVVLNEEGAVEYIPESKDPQKPKEYTPSVGTVTSVTSSPQATKENSKYYDNKNVVHQKWLCKQLEKAGVRPEVWEACGATMDGRSEDFLPKLFEYGKKLYEMESRHQKDSAPATTVTEAEANS